MFRIVSMAKLIFRWTIVFLLSYSARTDGVEEKVVYPVFLEGRSENGARVLRVTDELILNLQQQSAYGDQLLLRTTAKGGSYTQEYISASSYNDMLFQDEANMASVAITNTDGLHVRGMIGDKLRIKPLYTAERSELGLVPHLLYQEDALKGEAARYDYVAGPTIEEPAKLLEGIKIEQRSEEDINPEIHVFIDYIYYSKYDFNRDDIIVYFGAALNSINLRYKTIQELKITLCIVGFTFYSDEGVELTYLKKIRNSDYNDMIGTLEAFKEYYRVNDPQLFRRVDVLVHVTGRDFCIINRDRLDCTTGGIAYVAGACTLHRQSLIEDRAWSFDIVRAMAHEVAHSLGCVHDGEPPTRRVRGHPGAIECPWSWGYIMSYVQRDNNEYKFSPCCVAQMQYVSALPQYKCLFVNSSHTEMEKSRSLPGFVVTLNKLCDITFRHRGYSYFYDWNRQHDECRIPCRSQELGGRDRYDFGTAKAVDGTNCTVSGNKICIRGECVPRKRSNRRRTTTRPPRTPSPPERQWKWNGQQWVL
ncbi:venom metalloproteinase antarease-like TtrivMP_A [Ornithodoros turicata]|uniref:venom metalloproteinase antarease-like TtrivMP_A n=1 Tax=Ornithodoros turicata TaxID=34597 RepID=UPI0031391051